jgi:hypothetical protein
MSSVPSRNLALTERTELRGNEQAANDAADVVLQAERMTWLLELMSRFAREFAHSSDRHQSTRIAAAIVAHLRTMTSETLMSRRLNDASEHWFEIWDGILSQQLAGGMNTSDGSLRSLVKRAQML